MALVISNKVSYIGQLKSGPITTVTSNSIASQFVFDTNPTVSELFFYDNGLTNSNSDGELIGSVDSITNKVNNVSISRTNTTGNYYYSELLSEDGILYKSPPVRLFPRLNSVTLGVPNSSTDVFIISALNVSFPCNLKLTFYRVRSSGPDVEQSPPLILPSSSVVNYVVNRFDILPSDRCKLEIQALDVNNNIIAESDIRSSTSSTAVTTFPTVSTAPIVTFVRSGSYTVTWTTTISTGVTVTLINNGTTNSNSGGTVVSAATQTFAASGLTNTQTITLPAGTSINGTSYYYVRVTPVNLAGTSIGTALSSAVFRNATITAVTTSNISTTGFTVGFTRSILTGFRVSVYRNKTNSDTSDPPFDVNFYSTSGGSSSSTSASISATIDPTFYHYAIVQPVNNSNVEIGTPGKSANFIYPKVLTASILSFTYITAYKASWTTTFPTKVKVSLYQEGWSSILHEEIVASNILQKTFTTTVTQNKMHYIIVQPVNSSNSNYGIPKRSANKFNARPR
jgi:hypothetical protein